MRCKFEGEMTLDAEQCARLTRGATKEPSMVGVSERDTLKIALRAVQIYAERHPRPIQVTQAQAAEMLHLSAQTVNKLVRTGALRLNKCGRIPIEQVDAALLPA
jgi:hypothetical protein